MKWFRKKSQGICRTPSNTGTHQTLACHLGKTASLLCEGLKSPNRETLPHKSGKALLNKKVMINTYIRRTKRKKNFKTKSLGQQISLETGATVQLFFNQIQSMSTRHMFHFPLSNLYLISVLCSKS